MSCVGTGEKVPELRMAPASQQQGNTGSVFNLKELNSMDNVNEPGIQFFPRASMRDVALPT